MTWPKFCSITRASTSLPHCYRFSQNEFIFFIVARSLARKITKHCPNKKDHRERHEITCRFRCNFSEHETRFLRTMTFRNVPTKTFCSAIIFTNLRLANYKLLPAEAIGKDSCDKLIPRRCQINYLTSDQGYVSKHLCTSKSVLISYCSVRSEHHFMK